MNRKIIFILAVFLLIACQMHAQKYFSKTGDISFSSETPLENIEAESHTASTVMDMESQNIQWAVLIKSFEFEKALMQEHFNENYMESTKYTKAKFKGHIDTDGPLDFAKNPGSYEISGDLTIHGVTKNIKNSAEFRMEGDKIVGTCELVVSPEEFGIEIPSVVRNNIAKIITIKIQAQYEVLK